MVCVFISVRSSIAQAPLDLIGTWSFPSIAAGPYTDHLAFDAGGGRIFITPQADKAVVAIDVQKGKVLHTIAGFGNPHSVLFEPRKQRLFVADGGKGTLNVYDGKTYSLIKQVPLLEDTDGFSYDDKTRTLYVNNGGEGAGKEYVVISLVDVDSLTVKGEIRIDTDKLEATHISADGATLYADLPAKDVVAEIDIAQRKVLRFLPIGEAHYPMAIAGDDQRGILFVATRDTDVRGSIVVMSATSGAVVDRLPIGGWVDQVDWDPAAQRIYATCGTGQIFTFQRQKDGRFAPLASVDTAVMAKTSLFVPSLDRIFVAVPHLGDYDYRVKVFEVSKPVSQ